MFLPKPQRNQFSIGKHLRQLKSLRKKDSQAKPIEMPPELKQYVQYLNSKGMQVKNLDYALFYTKNGLPYPGLVARQKILANTIMLRLPRQSLLTTKKAFFSDIQKMFEENPKYFHKQFTQDWEDHILLAFLLYEYQKGPKSQWYHLIRNLPKDIDYAIFWDKKELKFMEDSWMELGITQQKKFFQEECRDFVQICAKYPQFYDKSTYSLENIKWIQSHLVTRCFGKYFQYTTMVPFAQLFNHECVDVYYSMDYKPGNPHTENEEFYPEKELTPEEQLEVESSDGSYDAEDFYEDDEYFEAVIPNQNEGKSAFKQNTNMSIDKDIKSIKSYMLTFINFGDSVSLNYLLQIFNEIQKAAESEVETEEQLQRVKLKLQEIHSLNVRYVKSVKQYYSDIKSRMYVYGIRQKKTKQAKDSEQELKEGETYFKDPWPDDKFDDFVMLCSTKDQFQQGAQVYFCYGRLPNKLLLLRYGIALQHNKYNHVFLRINVQSQVKTVKSFSFVVENQVNMRKYKRFKLKRTKFCPEFLTYLRSERWTYPEPVEGIFIIKDLQKQYQILEQAKQTLVSQLSSYRETLEKNRGKLYDKELNYHEYFCTVYKVQNQEILKEHIGMVDYAKWVIKSCLEGDGKKTLKQVLREETEKENLTRQLMMEQYFRSFDKMKD